MNRISIVNIDNQIFIHKNSINMKKINFVIFLLAMQTSAFSQLSPVQRAILGIVLDGETQEAIVGAVVYLKNTSISTFTDTGGRFQLPVTLHEPFVNVQVHHIAYKDETWTFQQNYMQVIRLTAKSNLLEPVIIRTPYTRVITYWIEPPPISLEEIQAYERAAAAANQAKRDSISAARKPKGWRFWKKIVE